MLFPLVAMSQPWAPGRPSEADELAGREGHTRSNSAHGGWNLHPKQYIYFSVADLGSTFEKAKNLQCKRIDKAIKTMPWGERLFYAKDPFNNPICFVDEATVFRG